MVSTEDLTGSINEVRRTFEGGGLTGQVEFGPRIQGGYGSTHQAFRVTLSNGREGWGRYASPKNVRVMLKAKRGKYARQRD